MLADFARRNIFPPKLVVEQFGSEFFRPNNSDPNFSDQKNSGKIIPNIMLHHYKKGIDNELIFEPFVLDDATVMYAMVHI